jgi:hypothetical protein
VSIALFCASFLIQSLHPATGPPSDTICLHFQCFHRNPTVIYAQQMFIPLYP